MITLKSLTSERLNKKKIIEICKLKNSYWNYGIKSNLDWFRKNVKKKDIHNLLYYQNKFAGYTMLARRCSILNKRKIEYLYFSTLIIKKKHRKLKLGRILMNFNNDIIINQKKHSFLICLKKSVSFYKKFNWKKLNNNNFKIVDHKFSSNGMVFNFRTSLIYKKPKYYVYK